MASVRQALRGGVMPWGKHKGRRLSAIPQDYLEWLYAQRPIPALRHQIGAELFRRRRLARADHILQKKFQSTPRT